MVDAVGVKSICRDPFGGANRNIASVSFGAVSHFDISTSNCGDCGIFFEVTTNFRGSGLHSSCWIHICQSTSGLRNARCVHFTPPMIASPTK